MSFVLILLSLSAIAAKPKKEVVWNEYRIEIKNMTLKSHKPLTNYSRSRKYIMQEIHLKSDAEGYYVHDVYCNINYRERVAPDSMPSSGLINIEHTMPKKNFNDDLSYFEQVSDLHNLYPTNSKANSVRGHKDFSDLSGNATSSSLEGCSASKYGYNFDAGAKGFEPPSEQKGNVARALFYFSVRYDITIGEHEEALMRLWNILDPVDSFERSRNDKIEKIQGNRNPFIDDAQYADLISNF